MVGAATACLLARSGFSVTVLEIREPRQYKPDKSVGLRVSALSPGSQSVLGEAGAWRQVSEGRHCDYHRMQVEDREPGSSLDFDAAEFGLEQLGTIVENELVQWSLWQSLQTLGGVDLICPAELDEVDFSGSHARVSLKDGRLLSTRLVLGADGADSAVRNAMGIGQQRWSYGQQGIVAVVKTAKPNQGIAWQRFLTGGPLAFLPLSDGQSSIVWSLPDADARRILELDDAGFCAALNSACRVGNSDEAPDDWLFGAALESGPRASFPLHMQLSDTYSASSAALLGDAAHVVHPLAGQGVNIGFLDAAALVEVLLRARNRGEDFAGEQVLQSYSRWRRSEAEVMARSIHSIRSMFTPEFLSPLRRLGLGLVSRSWILKESFIKRAAGRNRDAPALARGKTLGELMRTQKHQGNGIL